MFAIFEEEKWITIFMVSFLGLSVLIRLILGFLYQNMIREADNMGATRNKLLRQCKLKFANCFQLNNGVSNISVFVDKFLNRLSIGPVSFDTLYHLSGQLMLLSVVCSGVGACKSIIMGRMLGEILPFYIVSFLGLYLYFSISTVVDIKGKKRTLKVNLVDYLENHLSARIDVTENDMEMLYGRSAYGRSRVRGANGRRTVELMPIGGRLTIAEKMQVIDSSVDEEVAGYREAIAEEMETLELVEGIRREVRKAAGSELSGEMLEGAPVPGMGVNGKDEMFTKAQEKELEDLLKEFLAL